jgi:hypothetical protein
MMKNKAQKTEVRVSCTEVVVQDRISKWGSAAVPNIKQNINAMKLLRLMSELCRSNP